MTKASSRGTPGRSQGAARDGASPKAGGRHARLFVDAVEGGVARLLDGEQVFTLPARLLPPGVGEGMWVDVAITGPVAAPADTDEAERLRDRLSEDDPGGDITL